MKKKFTYPSVTIVTSTFNRAPVLRQTILGVLKLKYPKPVRMIVINDGSKDQTREVMKEFSRNKKIEFIDNEKELGPSTCRNMGYKRSKTEWTVLIDDDTIPNTDFLLKLMAQATSKKIGMISSYIPYGGNATAYLTKALKEVGYYDESFFLYREDTDLGFRILDRGYEMRYAPTAHYFHNHELEVPKSFFAFVKHALYRVQFHQKDALLFKKHPKRAGEFLDVQYGFLVNPASDFGLATGNWKKLLRKQYGPEGKDFPIEKDEFDEFGLSSPRGLTYLKNKSLLHSIIIILGGLAYVVAVKLARLYGTIKYRSPLLL